MTTSKKFFQHLGCVAIFLIASIQITLSQHSVARQWNDILLNAIRGDFARPTVHARNLFHVSSAMYDAWSAYDAVAEPYLLGRSVDGFILPFNDIPTPTDLTAAREEAISYAAYRLIRHRFLYSPGAWEILNKCDSLFTALGYDPTFISLDYTSNMPAALGNYIAEGYISYGLQDGSNEFEDYTNQFYNPVNSPLLLTESGNSFMANPNRWQPLSFRLFIDQSGQTLPGNAPSFLSPEWGKVNPFAMTKADLNVYTRDESSWSVYHDPGPPPYIQSATAKEFQWGFSLVSLWSSHLDPADSVKWDISPASLGNINIDNFPTTIEGLRDFYNEIEGGDPSKGHTMNPSTGQAYEPQFVPRGDYTRVLAEFWADGPDSETPPGHWFVLLNYVNDHPEFIRKFKGEGSIVDPLEWDVKAYFSMGGAMHDAAVSAWGIKGYYDYLRPISAIRWMAAQGQSSDPNLPNYSVDGISLYPGLIELIQAGDPLAGMNGEHINQIKVYAWRGPNYILDPSVTKAGVGWILAGDWWPYQRPTFVTPPFAGYISGHSTYSRAAAEVLTMLTGDPFFPGGMGEFLAKKNEFLVFEEGPSQDILLQWATYRDASDQTSLSRIWGGIHPPADDIPGRLIGATIGKRSFELAEDYFNGDIAPFDPKQTAFAYPNPLQVGDFISIALERESSQVEVSLYSLQGQVLYQSQKEVIQDFIFHQIPTRTLSVGIYLLKVKGDTWEESQKIQVN